MQYDRSIINTGSNDNQGSSIPSDPGLDEQTLAEARESSLGYLYWLQTACPRDEDPAKLGYLPMTMPSTPRTGLRPLPIFASRAEYDRSSASWLKTS
jgi:hypothetical protein